MPEDNTNKQNLFEGIVEEHVYHDVLSNIGHMLIIDPIMCSYYTYL